MKSSLLILFVLLSWLTGGKEVACDGNDRMPEGTLIEATSQDVPLDTKDYNVPCLTSARTANFSGEDPTISAPTVRSLGSGQRFQTSTKSSSRIIKDGKVVDKHNYFAFRQLFCSRPSGRSCFDRYIYSIHYLLI